MKAIIAGGGVGGLTAAHAFRRIGWDVEVFERAAAIEEVGAGIQISPNGFRVLDALGLGAAVRGAGFAPEAIVMAMGRSGRRMVEIPLAGVAEPRWGAPYLTIHRADLIAALAAALPPGVVRTGAEVVGYEEMGDEADGGVSARLASGETVRGDLLIGADGVRSTIRDLLLGPESPRFTGCVAWRAVAAADRLGAAVPPGPCVWAGEGRHAVTYPLAGGRVNFVGIVEEPNGWRGERWTEPGDPATLRALYGDWAEPVSSLVRAVEAPFRWALFERTPLPRWTGAHVALLGDACHAMLPSLAQGACQAMEDAWTLAACAGAPDGLTRYFGLRAARTARTQREAAANVRRFHKRGPLAKALGYAPIAAMGALAPGFFLRRMDWLYGMDVTALEGPGASL